MMIMKMKKNLNVVISELHLADTELYKVDLIYNSASEKSTDLATRFANMIDYLSSVDYKEDKLVFRLKHDDDHPNAIGELIQSHVYGGFSFIVLNKMVNESKLFMWTCQNSTLEHGSYMPDEKAPLLHCYCQVYSFPLPYDNIMEVQDR